MRVGIVGGGAAGLLTAWLLEDQHEVVLLERDDRLGGHCNTVPVSIEGQTYYVDAGIHYFSDALQPTFLKLLRQLDAPIVEYRPNSTFHDARSGWTVCMPPFGNATRMRGLMRGRTLKALLGLRKVIQCAIPLVEEEGDFSITLEEFLNGLLLAPGLAQDFLYPYLGSFWGVSADEVRTYSARNVLSYLVLLRPPVVSPLPSFEMAGGMQSYIELLVRDMRRATLRTGVSIDSIAREGSGYRVHTTDGAEEFDHLVMATNAAQASRLLGSLPGFEAQRQALNRVEYFDTKIAVHGDVSFLPPERASWSTVNGIYDGRYCATTDRCHANESVDLFRSWVTHANRRPLPVYAEITFQHPRPNPAYFLCQRELAPLQGVDNLWFTGMYLTHYDSHEGVVRSALRVARELSPGNARMAFAAGS